MSWSLEEVRRQVDKGGRARGPGTGGDGALGYMIFCMRITAVFRIL